MNKEIRSILLRLENVNSGEPWFGRSVYTLLGEVDTKKVRLRPGGTAHSLIDLLYHMITWADFTLKRIEKDRINDLAAAEELDWREIGPSHNWKKGLAEFKAIHKKIVTLLKKKKDSFLDEKVDYRDYNFRYLINGLIEHNIYHLGQITYLNKMLA
jgi:uncharacterized damage-inducible protein DinB